MYPHRLVLAFVLYEPILPTQFIVISLVPGIPTGLRQYKGKRYHEWKCMTSPHRNNKTIKQYAYVMAWVAFETKTINMAQSHRLNDINVYIRFRNTFLERLHVKASVLMSWFNGCYSQVKRTPCHPQIPVHANNKEHQSSVLPFILWQESVRGQRFYSRSHDYRSSPTCMIISWLYRLSMVCHTVSSGPAWVRIPGP